ncbi:putative MutT family protein [Trabulsiella guamensis ATCC 49490]|uniref:Putative MutT family protein n=1 Tax=Trabulsiella guamensis ATCC 49490 TaxID=1005994 RepID=A0A085A811_9ENTR|nr:NUDIX domain-containing protein [Trabulsiella guamensis]KFC06356.1 putative MutT family protein [Trabulsiella guamensis ATCC 49490]
MSTRFKPWFAVYLILRNENNVLLSRRMNTGYGDGQWSLPAGHVEENESALSAIIREAEEETGIHIQPDNLTLVYTFHRRDAGRTYIELWFETKKWDGIPEIREPDKCSGLEWFSISALPMDIMPYVRDVLMLYPQSHFGIWGLT